MNRSVSLPAVLLVSPLLVAIAGGHGDAPQLSSSASGPFVDLSLTVEANATDEDGEVVLTVEAASPVERLALVAPDGRLVQMISAEAGGIGISEIRLETGEPTLEDVRAAFPEGTYTVRAMTMNGEVCSGEVALSHDVPSRWEIRSPEPESVLARDAVHVEWTSDPSATSHTLEIEDSTTEIRLVATMQPGATSFQIPAALLAPGTEYQLVMVAHDRTGNRVVQERSFSTLP